jgi:hypothetical protein
MDTLFSSEQFNIKPQPSPYFREELFISLADAHSLGLNEERYFGILSVEPLYPGPPEEQFAVHIVVSADIELNIIYINQNFFNSVGFKPNEDRFWSVGSASAIIAVKEVLIELLPEENRILEELHTLQQNKRDLFLNRSLLIEPGSTVKNLSLTTMSWGNNIHSIQPDLETLLPNTMLVFDEGTTINLFVPYRKGGVDIVILVDASNSMNLHDYLGTDNQVFSRLEGVRIALETLLHPHFVSHTRIARIAVIVFAANAQMLYPADDAEMVELRNEKQLEEIYPCIHKLNNLGLERLEVNRGQTNISKGLYYAAELLDYYSSEGNEKIIMLLSDGANWMEDNEGESEGEAVKIITIYDPATIADELSYGSQIRIHTIAISDEQALRKYEDQIYWDQPWAVPNAHLLMKIADFSKGSFFKTSDAQMLGHLLTELGEGIIYPI